MPCKNKPNKEELRALLKHSTNVKVANYLEVDTKTIQRWRNGYKLNQEAVSIGDHELTKEQHDLIIGCLLGDASIPCAKESHKNHFRFGQKSDRKEYVQFVFDKLKPYSSSIGNSKPKPGPTKVGDTIIQNSGKLCCSTRMKTIAADLFSELRQEWYFEPNTKKSRKIVPYDLELNWNIFAYWFADDGSNNASRKTITLSTNCFSEEDVSFLCELIKRDLLIHAKYCNWNASPVITIGASDYYLVMSKLNEHLSRLKCLQNKLSEEYHHDYQKYNSSLSNEQIDEIWEKRNNNESIDKICTDYKISRSTYFRIVKKFSLDKQKTFPSGRCLKIEDVLEIINKWNDGSSQSEIAKAFNVSQGAISQIVQRKSRMNITKDLYIRGQEQKDVAIVSVIYNPSINPSVSVGKNSAKIQ